MNKKGGSLRFRLFLSFLLIILLSLAGVSVLVRISTQDELETFLGRGGLIGAESLIEDLENWFVSHGDWEGVETIMPHSSSPGQGSEAGQRTPGFGKLVTMRLADADRVLIYDPVTPQQVGLLLDDSIYSIPLIVDGETVGFLLPPEELGQENAQFEDRFLDRINQASLIAAAVSGSAALILAILLAYFLLKPVNTLVNATEKLADGDLSHRVDIENPQEFARLGQTFNQMAQSLQENTQKRKDLTADIAHELRTPLAVQRAHLEAMLDGVFPSTQENINTVLQQNQLLSRLVEDLRVLTLTDSGELNLDLQPLDLGQLVASTVRNFSARAKEKQIEFKLVLAECAMIYGDAERIQQIIHNLLQNGIRYTPKNASLALTLSCTSSEVVLTVRDTGPGISGEMLPYIFDRFSRKEKSRSREDGGTGLGLAIARSLANIHQGSLVAANHPDGGAFFTLKLPLIKS